MAKRATTSNKNEDTAVPKVTDDALPNTVETKAPAMEPAAPAMTPEEIDEAIKNADFSIQEEPEKPTAIPPAMMFDADTKVTPALIIKRMEEEAAKRKLAAQANPENLGPRTETRANGRRVIKHN